MALTSFSVVKFTHSIAWSCRFVPPGAFAAGCMQQAQRRSTVIMFRLLVQIGKLLCQDNDVASAESRKNISLLFQLPLRGLRDIPARVRGRSSFS